MRLQFIPDFSGSVTAMVDGSVVAVVSPAELPASAVFVFVFFRHSRFLRLQSSSSILQSRLLISREHFGVVGVVVVEMVALEFSSLSKENKFSVTEPVATAVVVSFTTYYDF